MEASDFTPRRNRAHIGVGLDELYLVLKPFVEQQMALMYGAQWRARACEILKRPAGYDFEKDLENLLKLIQRDYDRTFAGILKSDGRTPISNLLTARHDFSHQYQADLSFTFFVYEALCKVFERLKYNAPAITARRAALHSLVAQMAPPLPPDAVATDGEGGDPPAEPESATTLRAAGAEALEDQAAARRWRSTSSSTSTQASSASKVEPRWGHQVSNPMSSTQICAICGAEFTAPFTPRTGACKACLIESVKFRKP